MVVALLRPKTSSLISFRFGWFFFILKIIFDDWQCIYGFCMCASSSARVKCKRNWKKKKKIFLQRRKVSQKVFISFFIVVYALGSRCRHVHFMASLFKFSNRLEIFLVLFLQKCFGCPHAWWCSSSGKKNLIMAHAWIYIASQGGEKKERGQNAQEYHQKRINKDKIDIFEC